MMPSAASSSRPPVWSLIHPIANGPANSARFAIELITAIPAAGRDAGPGDPFAGTESFEQQVGWHLEDEICNEEDAGAETERGLRQTKVLVQLERGETHVHAVRIHDQMADDEERYELLGDFGDSADFYSVHKTARLMGFQPSCPGFGGKSCHSDYTAHARHADDRRVHRPGTLVF